jgi:hypothetical protein
MLISYFFLICAMTLLLAIFILNILSQKKYEESKIIYISNPDPPCTFGSDLPVVEKENLGFCLDEDNNEVLNYYVYTFNSALKFVVTNKKETFYMDICNQLCPDKLLNGNCNSKIPGYETCIFLLEPPAGCTNPAKPIFTDKNGIEYFAAGIYPSPKNDCVAY